MYFLFKNNSYDDYCQNIILPLVNTKKLRDNGITLHLSISKSRDRVEDVTAVYFVEPTKENIEY